MPLAQTATSVPVIVNDDLCIADKGCTVCVDVCPLDVLRIAEAADGGAMVICQICVAHRK